jgi:hypothetical protein
VEPVEPVVAGDVVIDSLPDAGSPDSDAPPVEPVSPVALLDDDSFGCGWCGETHSGTAGGQD